MGYFRNYRLRIVAGALLATSAACFAQSVERIEVTGSRIKRVDVETAAPVTILNREDIERTGAENVSDVIRGLTIDNNGSIPSAFGAGFAAGSTAVSIRGLGINSTLVLLNGRRVAPYGLADDGARVFTDLSSIPLDAVDRIEVLKDGASAIYGADAVGGVINIILRSNYTGVTARASMGQTRYGDGKAGRASATVGFGNLVNDRYNIVFNVEMSRQDAIFKRDRYGRGAMFRQDMSESGYDYLEAPQYGTLIPGALVSGGPSGAVRAASGGFDYRFLPCVGGTGPNFSATALAQYPTLANNFSSSNGGPAGCVSNAFDYSMVQPKEERKNFYGRGTLSFSQTWQAYFEASRFQARTWTFGAPSSVSGFWPDVANLAVRNSGGITIADNHPDNPFAPDGIANRLRYVTADVGGGTGAYDNVATRLLAGAKGTSAGWDIDGGIMYSTTELEIVNKGRLRDSVLRDYLSGTNVTGLNPTLGFYRLGVNSALNAPSLYSAISPDLMRKPKTSVKAVDFKASRELMQMAGGPLGLALGIEWRHEKLDNPANPYTDIADIIGAGYSAFKGERKVAAFFAELNAPFTRTIEGTLAVRTDKYSDYGRSTTPKLGVKWTPSKQWLFRGTYAEGFRAPSAAEIGNSLSAGYTSNIDPLLCPVTGYPADCGGFVVVMATGSPLVKAETSKSYTVGLIWEPFETTNISVDYWRVDRTNGVGVGPVVQVRQDDGRGLVGVGNPAVNGGAGAFRLVGLMFPYSNTTRIDVSDGVDIDFRQRVNLGGYGRLTAALQWSHLERAKHIFPDGKVIELANSHGPTWLSGNGGTPKDRIALALTWDVGAWSTTARMNHVGHFANKETATDTTCLNHFFDGSDAPEGCKIKAFTTWDLFLKWKGVKNLEVFGSVRNLFDKVPPFDPQVYSAFHYNPIYHLSGAIGRQYNVGLKYTFK